MVISKIFKDYNSVNIHYSVISLMLALILAGCLVPQVSGYQTTYQDDTEYEATFSIVGSDTYVTLEQDGRQDDYRLKVYVCEHDNLGGRATITYPTQTADYLSFDFVGGGSTDYIYSYFGLISSEGYGNIDVTALRSGSPSGRYEFIKSGTIWRIYRNGVYQSQFTYDTYPDSWRWSAEQSVNNNGLTYMDNIVMTSHESECWLLSRPPDDWYVLSKPGYLTTGLYDPDDYYIYDNFKVDWARPSQYYKGDTTNYADRIDVVNFNSGEPVYTVDLDETAISGSEYIDVDEAFVQTDAPYGLYWLKLYRSDNTMMDGKFITYVPELIGGNSIEWDKVKYYTQDTASVTIELDEPGYAEYTYRGVVRDIYGTQKEAWVITTDNSTHEFDIDSWDTGLYYASIELTDKDSGEAFDIMYAPAEVSEAVAFEGTVYDLVGGNAISGAEITFTQLSEDYTDSSDASGEYLIEDLQQNYNINISASKTGYTFSNYTYKPLAPKRYNLDLYMMPSSFNYTNTSLYGQVYTEDNHQGIDQATCTLSLDTPLGYESSVSMITSSIGFYLFEDLTPESDYSLSASADGFPPSEVMSGTLGNDTATQQDVPIEGRYSLTLKIYDAKGRYPIGEPVSIFLDNGASTESVNGQATFSNLPPAVYIVETASTEQYYGSNTVIVVDEDTEKTIYLQEIKESTSGAGVAYPPHMVKFELRSVLGTPIENANVSAKGIEFSAGPWDWLMGLLGIDTEETPIHNSTMEGTTDSYGIINFMMIPAIKYEMKITKNNETLKEFTVYPKDDYYAIIFGEGETWQDEAGDPLDVIVTSVSAGETDDRGNITVSYLDKRENTNSVLISVLQQNPEDYSQKTEIDSETISDNSNFSQSFLIDDYSGESYFVNLQINQSDFGDLERDYAVKFPGVRVELGNIPDEMYIYVAIGILLLTGAIFGAVTSHFGAIIVCFVGWLLYGFGWLDELGLVGPTALTFATVVAVIGIIVKRYKEEGYI